MRSTATLSLAIFLTVKVVPDSLPRREMTIPSKGAEETLLSSGFLIVTLTKSPTLKLVSIGCDYIAGEYATQVFGSQESLALVLNPQFL